MSLKHYAFVLFAVFVFATAIIQIVFIHYVQQKMSDEIQIKSKAISEQTIKLLLAEPKSTQGKVIVEFDSTMAANTSVNSVVRQIDINGGVIDKRIKMTPAPDAAQPDAVQKEELIEMLERIEVKPRENHMAYFISMDNSPDINRTKVIEFSTRDSVVNQYFNWLTFLTLSLGAAGIVFAYWLARHLSHPLSSLADGFKKLKAGDLGSQIPPTGVNEVKQTIQEFNLMSARLAELKQLEKKFEQQQQLADLGEMTRGLAHTLRNPLNTIGLSIEQLLQPNQNEDERQQLAAHIRQKMQHLDGTIKSLLSLSTSDIKRNESINVGRVIEDVVMELSMASPVKIVYSPAQTVYFTCAEQDLRTLFQALIANAVEASQSSGQVTVFADKNEHVLTFAVLDEGEGIDKDIQPHLFTPHSTTKPEGAGMGLFIVKQIAQTYYNGEVSLQPVEPTGCQATLVLKENLENAND